MFFHFKWRVKIFTAYFQKMNSSLLNLKLDILKLYTCASAKFIVFASVPPVPHISLLLLAVSPVS